MEVFCSTGGFEDMPFYETGKLFSKLGINKIELSAGVPSKDVVKQLTNLSQDSDLMLHNYFPPPEIPFVLGKFFAKSFWAAANVKRQALLTT